MRREERPWRFEIFSSWFVERDRCLVGWLGGGEFVGEGRVRGREAMREVGWSQKGQKGAKGRRHVLAFDQLG